MTIAEQTGYDSVDVSVSDPSGVNRNASASVSGLSGRLGAGDSRTGTATVSIDGDAAQHAEKTWTVQLDTDDPDAERKSFRIDARVIYPAMFGDSTGTGASYTFDERRGESTFTREVTTTVENTGDLPLAIEDVSVGSPTFDDDYVSAELTRASDSVPGLDSRDYNLDVTLDSEVPEGDHTLSVRFTSSNASAGTQTVEVPLTVEHETELDTDSERVEFGQLEISRTDTATVTVSEALGYNAIENLTLQRVDGPDQGWLTVQRDVPEQLAAGSESQTVFGLQFDTDAEVLTPYEWTYRVDGDDVEPRTITVTAEPGIIEGEETHERLQSFGDHPDLGESAGSMDEMLTRLEEKIEDGDLESGQDISRGFTAAQTFVEYLDAAERVQEVRESEGNEAAQDELVRSASTYSASPALTASVVCPATVPPISATSPRASAARADSWVSAGTGAASAGTGTGTGFGPGSFLQSSGGVIPEEVRRDTERDRHCEEDRLTRECADGEHRSQPDEHRGESE